MVHDVDVERVVVQVEGEDPGGTLEEQVELLLLVGQLSGDVKDVLLPVQRQVPVPCTQYTIKDRIHDGMSLRRT